VFVLEVRLSVVTDDPVSIGRGGSIGLSRGNLAMLDVVKTLEQTITQVHVANRVDAFRELDGAGKLAVPVAPVVLNAFHVPLVDNNDDFLAF